MDAHERMAHARSNIKATPYGRPKTDRTRLLLSQRHRAKRDTDVARFFDAICANHVMTLAEIGRKTGTTPGYLSRLRSGARVPSHKWLREFIANCGLDGDEIAVAGQLFNPVREASKRTTPLHRINPVDVLRPEDV